MASDDISVHFNIEGYFLRDPLLKDVDDNDGDVY